MGKRSLPVPQVAQAGEGAQLVSPGLRTPEVESTPESSTPLRGDSLLSEGWRNGHSIAAKSCQRPVGCSVSSGEHKHSGTPDSVQSTLAFSNSAEGADCSGPDGRKSNSISHKSPRWH